MTEWATSLNISTKSMHRISKQISVRMVESAYSISLKHAKVLPKIKSNGL